jgi:hypothetical protein
MAASAVALAASVSVSACSSDGGSLVSGESIHDMLGALPEPEGGEVGVVAYADLSAAAEIAGVEAPDDASDEEAVGRYLGSIFAFGASQEGDGDGSVAGAIPPSIVQHVAAQPEVMSDEVGWNVLEVDRFAEISPSEGPTGVTVLQGDFDGGDIEDAPGATEEDGAVVLGDPSGDLDLRERSEVRRMGEPWWMDLDGNRLVITGAAQDMEAARSAHGGDGTLAGNAVLAALAEALDGEDAYAAQLTAAPGTVGEQALEDRPDAQELCGEQALADMPAGVATGIADDDGPVVLVALVHTDDAAARANAESLEELVREGTSLMTGEPWSDRLTVDQVTRNGPVVVGRFRPVEPTDVRLWFDVFNARDGLVATC